jgi:hypothetical protein
MTTMWMTVLVSAAPGRTQARDAGRAKARDAGRAQERDAGKAQTRDTGRAQARDVGRAQARDAGGARAAARARWARWARWPLACRHSSGAARWAAMQAQGRRSGAGRLRGGAGTMGSIWVQAATGVPLARRAGLGALAPAVGGAWCARVYSPLRCTIVLSGSSVDGVLALILQGPCPAMP